MDRAAEVAFAWALLHAARGFVDHSAYSWLCTKLGAGETQSVIRDLLAGFVGSSTPLPAAIAPSLSSWVDGFHGSDAEVDLRDIAARLRLTEPGAADAATSGPAARLVARQTGRAADGFALVLVPPAL
ncbi:MAG: hypothetical protein PGN27_03290 [Mycolicibacterium neoaurum]|uniref:hypothetical protein n=1 Tax=Mycolicibacterium neoaurum TaxID=1795 RepID=UPI002FF6A552